MNYIRPFILVIFLLLVRSTSLFGQWVQANGTPVNSTLMYSEVTALVATGADLFAGTDDGVYGHIFLSTNDGANWSTADSGLPSIPYVYVQTFAVKGASIFAGTWRNGVFRSTNNGTSWEEVNYGLTNLDVRALAVNDTDLFAGTETGVFRSSNNGATWIGCSPFPKSKSTFYDVSQVVALVDCGAYIIAGTDSIRGFALDEGGIFMSTDKGMSWTAIDSGISCSPRALAIGGATLFAGMWYTIYVTTDNGMIWELPDSSTYSYVNSFALFGSDIFAGGADGVSVSTDAGHKWVDVSSGLKDESYGLFTIVVKDKYLFAGTGGVGVWRRPLSEMITSINERVAAIPNDFLLSQNYPNPFNPSTKINYRLPSNVMVVLKVFDILGREVATLVSERQTAGNHGVAFNAGNLPSGVYFYRLLAGTFAETKKLTVLK